MFALLAEQGINIKLITTSEIKVSCLIDGTQARAAVEGLQVVEAQTAQLDGGVDHINDSGVRILHSARALRKVAVAPLTFH